MKPVTFVTPNESKHHEVQKLLAGLDVRWTRLDLARPDTCDLEIIARARAAEAFRRLGEPCFVENTGLFLWDHDGEPGSAFKRTWRELGEEGFAARYGGSRGTARVIVALAESGDPADARVFAGSIAGEVLREPRGPGGYGWDRIWIPDGYDRTLGEMTGSSYVVNMRAAPYLELADHLRGRVTPGTFEAHVTVRLPEGAGAKEQGEAFRVACRDLDVKHITIELPDGETPRQPMTASFHRGELLDVQREVVAIARELVRRGFEVTRTKIEAHGRLLGAPETDEEARHGPSTSYFEYHVKLALLPTADLAAIGRRMRSLGAHLSKNASKPAGPGGLVERFVTLRAHGVGRVTAEARFQTLCDAIQRDGLVVRNRIREYTVFDTNVELDRGWIEA